MEGVGSEYFRRAGALFTAGARFPTFRNPALLVRWNWAEDTDFITGIRLDTNVWVYPGNVVGE